MLAQSFLIESSSKLLVTRTGIKAWMSLISGRIRQLTLELLALEWWTFYTFKLFISLRPVGQSWPNFMCSITGGGERLHNVLRQIGSNSGFHGNRKPLMTYNGKKKCLHLFSVVFDPILFILAGNMDMQNLRRVQILARSDHWLCS